MDPDPEDLRTGAPRLAALVLRCADLEATARFYGELGLSLTAEKHGEGPSHYSTLLGETLVEFYPASSAPSGPSGSVERLTIALPGAACVVTDPDGRRVEIVASQ